MLIERFAAIDSSRRVTTGSPGVRCGQALARLSSPEELLICGHGLSRENHLSAEQPAFKDR
jgi:hypothetical protein